MARVLQVIVMVVQREKLTISKNKAELFRDSEASVLVKIALGMKKAASLSIQSLIAPQLTPLSSHRGTRSIPRGSQKYNTQTQMNYN